MKIYTSIIFSLLFVTTGMAQKKRDNTALLKTYEDSLKSIQYAIFKGKDDSKKVAANKQFLAIMKRALAVKNSFDYPFDSLTTISRITSPDKRFRILNWDLPKMDDTFDYYGYIQVLNKQTKKYVVFPLMDKTDEIRNPENAPGTNTKWYGMLYYKIIKESSHRRTYYTLLAWQGYNSIITHKIIDVLYFSRNGTPHFGKNIFKMEHGKNPKRVIFKYSADVYMSLKYNKQMDMILFDYVAPPQAALDGQYQYYGPTFRVDGLAFKKGKWQYQKNVDARNPKSRNDQLNNNPKGKEKVPYKKKALYTPH